MKNTYHTLVIGTGCAGYHAAERLHTLGVTDVAILHHVEGEWNKVWEDSERCIDAVDLGELEELADEGELTPITYAPQFVLSGEYYSLNFGQEVVVLNIRQANGSSGRQYSRRRCPADDEVIALLRRRTAERTLRR